MLNDKQIEQLVRSFMHEACIHLDIDDSKIHIVYMSLPLRVLICLLKDTDVVVINSNELLRITQKNAYSVIRLETYRVAREIYQRRNSDNVDIQQLDGESKAIDATAFSYALSFLYGLGIVIPKQFGEALPKRIEYILNEDFHEDCYIHRIPDKQFKGEYTYRAKKMPKAHKQIINSVMGVSPKLVTTSVAEGQLGSETNPFRNVLEACDFIQEEEKNAYQADFFHNTVLANRHFNYLPDKNIYNVVWADGKLAYCHPEVPTDGFLVNQLVSGRFSLKPNLYGRKFLFRGQNKYYERCMPGLFRDNEQNYFLKENILYNELRAILSTHPLVKLFESGIELWHDIFRFEVNYGGLAQHYYSKTSFLDLTSDIEAAKFFAVTQYDNKTDEYSPYTKDGLGVIYYYEISEPSAFMPKCGQCLSTIGKQVFMRSGSQHGFLLNMDKGVNFNSLPQVHKVFFKHDASVSEQVFIQSKKGELYFPWDILQEQWKRVLASFEENPSVSMEAVRLDVKDNIGKNETKGSIIRKLSYMYGIGVDKQRIPCFDTDLLDRYYADIKNGWWQDVFCKDLYFAASDGIVYKDMLMKVPIEERYHRFFRR